LKITRKPKRTGCCRLGLAKGKEKLWLAGEGEVVEGAGSPKTKSLGGGGW